MINYCDIMHIGRGWCCSSFRLDYICIKYEFDCPFKLFRPDVAFWSLYNQFIIIWVEYHHSMWAEWVVWFYAIIVFIKAHSKVVITEIQLSVECHSKKGLQTNLQLVSNSVASHDHCCGESVLYFISVPQWWTTDGLLWWRITWWQVLETKLHRNVSIMMGPLMLIWVITWSLCLMIIMWSEYLV